MKENILGYEVDVVGVDDCCELMVSNLSAERRRWMACFNPHSYAVSCDDSGFAAALRNADWLVADGVGVVLASRALGGSVPGRVTGSDVFIGMHRRMNLRGGFSVFFMGATEETLEIIRDRMSRDFPNVRVSGVYSPPFKPSYSPEELAEMVKLVNDARPDVLWVGMTAPKQEKWIYENLAKLDVGVACAVGAVFDFYAGRIKRSHPVFQRIGLEWLPRLLQEPRRLWRRMLISAPIFIWHVMKQKVGRL